MMAMMTTMTTTDQRDQRTALLRNPLIDTLLLVYKQSSASEKLGLRHVIGSVKRGRTVRPCAQQDADWPRRTDTWCWHCCHPFDTPPLPMPVEYDDRRDKFVVTGTFCSWSCMKTYNSESATHKKNVISMIIKLFIKRCTGSMAFIRFAPPRVKLRAFGGSMSIEEFRAASSSGSHVAYVVLPPKMIVYEPRVEQEAAPRSKHRPCGKDDTVSFKDVRARNETLRLKRPKPLQNNKNALERTIGTNGIASIVATRPIDG